MNKNLLTVMQYLKSANGEGKWFDVPQSDFKVYVAIVLITPELAEKLLAMNKGNRPKSKAYINRYAKVMKQHRWMFNAQAILFDFEGFCIDGQHRLEACVQSGESFTTMVCINLKKEIFATLDCGRSRTLAQLLAVGNTPNYTSVAAVVKAYTALAEGKTILNSADGGFRPDAGTKLDNDQLVSIYNDNSEDFDLYGQRAQQLGTAVKKHPISGSIAAAYWMYLVKDKGYEDAFVEKFFKMLYSHDTAEDHNVNLLRVKFMDMRAGTTSHQSSDRQNYMLSAAYKRNCLAFVWNYYATDHKPVQKLTYSVSKGDIEFLSAAQAEAMK